MEISYLILLLVVTIVVTTLITCYCAKQKCNLSIDEEVAINTFIDSRHAIKLKDVKDLYNNYKDRFINVIKDIQKNAIERTDLNGKTVEYLPTEYSLIPIQKLKDYINFLEAIEKKNNKKISGIAINFGAYNLNKVVDKDKRSASSIEDPIRSGDYRGRLTTFFTPTFYDGSKGSGPESHVPFYIKYDDDSDKFKGAYIPMDTYTKSERNSIPQQFIMQSMQTNINSVPDNSQSVSSNDMTDMPPETVTQ